MAHRRPMRWVPIFAVLCCLPISAACGEDEKQKTVESLRRKVQELNAAVVAANGKTRRCEDSTQMSVGRAVLREEAGDFDAAANAWREVAVDAAEASLSQRARAELLRLQPKVSAQLAAMLKEEQRARRRVEAQEKEKRRKELLAQKKAERAERARLARQKAEEARAERRRRKEAAEDARWRNVLRAKRQEVDRYWDDGYVSYRWKIWVANASTEMFRQIAGVSVTARGEDDGYAGEFNPPRRDLRYRFSPVISAFQCRFDYTFILKGRPAKTASVDLCGESQVKKLATDDRRR